ncbi:MAG TPA: hypothetical protein VMF65_10875 [Acidimicrobiales bacterium]|nr:hypothetical protein [Acidimicrobiales bacterium]
MSAPALQDSSDVATTEAHHVVGMVATLSGAGYLLVGWDGGAYIFGTGVKFHGSRPGENIRVNNIVSLALTPDVGGYWMAGSDGRVYGFGDAKVEPTPGGLASNLPVAAIVGT